jgi:integrase
MRVIRPAITNTESPWLFPNQHGAGRNATAFSRGIEAFIARETGLDMNPHFFRHFAVLMQQRMNPGDRETPRQLLGHRSNATTEGAYTRPDTAGAAKRHDALITSLLNRNSTVVTRKARGRKS